MRLTMKEKQTLTKALCGRYRTAGKKDKTKILDEFTQVTGYNRKYALHLLTHWGKTRLVKLEGQVVQLTAGKPKQRKKRAGKLLYGPEVIESLRLVWEFFGFMCGKLLAPFLRQQMPFFEPWPAFHITPEVREKLLTISPATIDRRLKGDRKKLMPRGKSGTKPGTLLKKHIPVRVYYPWSDRKPGFFEIDTVHHCGDRESGEFCLTFTGTDVYSGWVELRPLLNKAQKWCLQALADIRQGLPFPLLGIDSDNGSEFINAAMVSFCDVSRIQFTRSRAYHKNDNCFVEQKNDHCVRQYVGYSRFDTPSEQETLALVYRSLCPLLNYFLPTSRLLSKTRIGSRIKKVYDAPRSPYLRLLDSSDLTGAVKDELGRRYRLYNPVLLQQQVHQAVSELMSLNQMKQTLRRQSLVTTALENT
jgi:hypothetical protein